MSKHENPNRLNHAQFFRLCDALRTHVDAIDKGRMRLAEAAAFMAEKVGFPVTPKNLQSAAKAANVTWVGLTRPTVGPIAKQVLVELQHRVEVLEKVVEKQDAVIDAVYLLFHKLGEKVPANLPVSEAVRRTNGVITRPSL